MNFQTFKKQFGLRETVFISILILSLLLLLYSIRITTLNTPGAILFYFTTSTLLILLSYIAYKDFKDMEIDNLGSLVLMISLLVLNILLYFGGYKETGIEINSNFDFIPYNNIYLALLLGLVSFAIVLITNEKALGSGDIRLSIIAGLLIGKHNLLIWLSITIFTSLIYGLILGYKKKSLKKLKIPFAPFMILGIIASILIDLHF